MAEYALTPSTTPRRRTMLAMASSVVLGSGITAGIAASVADVLPTELGTEMLLLEAELSAAVAEVGHFNMADDLADEDDVLRAGIRLNKVCRAIIDSRQTRTAAGLALSAAAVMHQLQFNYGPGGWESSGDEMAWKLLGELAGDAFVPVTVPDYAQVGVPVVKGGAA